GKHIGYVYYDDIPWLQGEKGPGLDINKAVEDFNAYGPAKELLARVEKQHKIKIELGPKTLRFDAQIIWGTDVWQIQVRPDRPQDAAPGDILYEVIRASRYGEHQKLRQAAAQGKYGKEEYTKAFESF